MLKETNITFFKTPLHFRKWLLKNQDKCKELWVGYYKKDTGKPSITWQESVDEALCFGWIDGIRKKIDELSYAIRFTPRNPKSNWSKININRITELNNLGLVNQKGWELFEKRDKTKSEEYSFEQRKEAKLPNNFLKIFKANKKAWDFFQSQPEGYKRIATWWCISAKQEETKLRRLNQLILDSESQRKIAPIGGKKQ